MHSRLWKLSPYLFVFMMIFFCVDQVASDSRQQGDRRGTIYDLQTMWPFPNAVLWYQYYDSNGQPHEGVPERIWHERWADGAHFTIHHWGDSWCPRTDDVMVWDTDRLLYTDTYDFWRNHHTALSPGQVWADRFMVGDAPAQFSDVRHDVFNTTHNEACSLTTHTFWYATNDRVWRRLLEGYSAWSPFTGGQEQMVPVVRLDQTTYINQNDNDWFKEEWYFYDHPSYGWIAIHSKGYRQEPLNTAPSVIWNMRLINITDLASHHVFLPRIILN